MLTVKQGLRHEMIVEEGFQREENVSARKNKENVDSFCVKQGRKMSLLGTCVVKRAAAATTCGHFKR